MTAPRPSAKPGPAPFTFPGLPQYSRREASLATQLARAFPDAAGWSVWIQDALAGFLERPAGVELRLQQRHAVDASQPAATLVFDQEEVVIGRDAEADVSIPVRTVGGRHAKLRRNGDRYFVEDLGSPLGTYLNKRKLAPNAPQPVAAGDHVDIFPYSFHIDVRRLWTRGDEVELHAGPAVPMAWSDFNSSSPRGRTLCAADIFPAGALCVETGRHFLEAFTDRLFEPLGIAPERLGLTDAADGALQLVVSALLERVNRELQFPLCAEPLPAGLAPVIADGTRGLVFEAALRIADLTGAFRLFVPFSLAQRLSEVRAGRATDADLPVSVWLSAGNVDLTAAELASVECDDVLLYSARSELLLGGSPDRGWAVTLEPGNPSRAVLDKYFERVSLRDEQTSAGGEEAAARPDLDRLPVRVHVILGEAELTMAEARELVAGSIVELGAGGTDSVRLAVNGKVIGEGRLVDIEGRLGVRITAWRAA